MIKLINVTKKYKKYLYKNTLKGLFLNNKNNTSKNDNELYIVRNLSLHISSGEIICIVGRNGAGKSTLAKLIAGTIYPSSGTVEIKGKIVPFLELGVAFQSELDGKDNAIMNGVLLGMSIHDVKNKLKDIFDFAEITDFINTPLKFYSSGMLMRLAYSIGIHSDGDIFLFDEILAVGDEKFQKKCFASFETLIKNKKTIILITHDLNIVSQYATAILLLDNGKYFYTKEESYIKKIREKTIDELYQNAFKS